MDLTRPEAAGFSAHKLNQLVPLLQGYVDTGKAPGVVFVLARQGKVVFAQACGVMDLRSRQPMPVDGIFRLASQTKPITAAAVLMLAEAGALHIGDAVEKYLPEFSETRVFDGVSGGRIQLAALERSITIEDLLTHQAGLTPMPPGEYPLAPELDAIYSQALAEMDDPQLDQAAMVSKIAALPLCDQPGRYWRYAPGFEVLTRVVEVAAGMPFADLLQQRLFAPLGMLDSGFFVPPEKAGRLVRANILGEAGEVQDEGDAAQDICLHPPLLISGGGNLLSTALDYTRFAQMLANGGELDGVRLLARRSVEDLAANRLRGAQLPYGPLSLMLPVGYGFGLGVRVLLDPQRLGIPASAGEFGWSGWYSTGVWIDPAEQLSGVFMAQVAPPEAFWPHLPPLDVRRIVYQALDGR